MPAPAATDLIDQVNERNIPVGEVPRGEALSLGANFRTVHVLLHDENGWVLLQRLAPERDRHPGRWGSSVAGYLHAGEPPSAGAQRRTAEELGIRPELTASGVHPTRDNDSLKFVSVFTGSGTGASIQDPLHVAEIAWFRPDQIDAIVSNPEAVTPTFRVVWHVAAASAATGLLSIENINPIPRYRRLHCWHSGLSSGLVTLQTQRSYYRATRRLKAHLEEELGLDEFAIRTTPGMEPSADRRRRRFLRVHEVQVGIFCLLFVVHLVGAVVAAK